MPLKRAWLFGRKTKNDEFIENFLLSLLKIWILFPLYGKIYF
jgi:hypothetical protein